MATRLYPAIPGSAGDIATGISPTPDASWEKTTGFDRVRASTATPTGTGSGTIDSTGTGVNPNDILMWQCIAGPFDPITFSGTFKSVWRTREFDAATNARAQCVVRVFSLAGASLATLVSSSTAALSNEFVVGTLETRRFPLNYAGAGVAVSATISEPFYVVAEFGARVHSTDTTNDVRVTHADTASGAVDGSETEGTTTSPAFAWFEFSQNLVNYVTEASAGHASGTGAAHNATVSLLSPPRSITINGVDYTDKVRLHSFLFTEAANRGEVGTGFIEVDDASLALTIPAMKAMLVEEPTAGPSNKILFAGYTHDRSTERGPSRAAGQRQWRVEAIDLNTLADDYILTGGESADRPAESDYLRVLWLLTTRFNTVANVAVGVVPNTNTVNMDAMDYRGRTAREVLNECSEMAGKNWFIYLHTGTQPKLFYDVTSSTNLTSTSKISDVPADIDSVTTWAAIGPPTVRKSPDAIYSKVHLRYNAGTVSVSNATTASNYRTREISVTDMSIETSAKATAKATAFLAASAVETTRINDISVALPAANVNDFRAGQRFQLKLARHGISSFTYYRILRREIRALNDVSYLVTLTLADEVLPTNYSNQRGGDVYGIWERKSNATDDGATVIVDRGGITILEGAMTLVDAFGATVMEASGFSGSWGDFVRLGLYNARFTVANTSGIAAGRTTDLPYWTVSGSGAMTGLASAGIKSTFGALNDGTTIISDAVPVRPGSTMEAGFGYLVNRVAGTLTINGFVRYFQADGSASAITPSDAFANEVKTASVTDLTWVTNSSLVPSDAVTAELRIDVSETVAHNAANYVSVYGAKLIDMPVVIPPAPFFSDDGIPSVVTPSGTSDDYDPGSIDTTTLLRVQPTAAWTLRGMVVPSAKWRLVYLYNYSSGFTITIKHDNAGSTAALRFSLPGAADITVPTNTGCLLMYNTTQSRWNVLTSA